MRRRRAFWFLAGATAVLLASGATILLLVRPARIKARVERVVSSHLHLRTQASLSSAVGGLKSSSSSRSTGCSDGMASAL
jgi:hypothetical protein